MLILYNISLLVWFYRIRRSPRIEYEIRHPHISHVPFKSRGREHRIVYTRIAFELARFGGYKWREFERAVVGKFLRAIGAGSTMYTWVSLGKLLTAVHKRRSWCGCVSFGVYCSWIVWRLGSYCEYWNNQGGTHRIFFRGIVAGIDYLQTLKKFVCLSLTIKTHQVLLVL